MTKSDGYFNDLAEAVGAGWNRFWFTPSDPLPCSVLRIAVGVIVVLHLVSLGQGLDRWFARDGLLPPLGVKKLVLVERMEEPYYHYSLFNQLDAPAARVAHYAAIGLAVAFTLGILTRITGALTVLALLSYIHRLPLVMGHVDPLLVFLVAYLCLGPSMEYWSVDRWLRGLRSKEPLPSPTPSLAAGISLRCIQVHMAMFVAMMGLSKLWGEGWWDGEAVWVLLAQTMSRPVDLSALHDWHFLINFWTHAIVGVELAFPILIWNRHARPLLLVLAAAVWLSMILATGLALFGLTLIAASLAFVPAERLRALLGVKVRVDAEEPALVGAAAM